MLAVARIFTRSGSAIGRSINRRIVGVELATSKKSMDASAVRNLHKLKRKIRPRRDPADDRGVAMPRPLQFREDRQCLRVGKSYQQSARGLRIESEFRDRLRNFVRDAHARRIVLTVALAAARNHSRAALLERVRQQL